MNQDLERLLLEVRTGGMEIDVARMSAGVLYGRGEVSTTDLIKFDKSLRRKTK